MPGVCCIHSLHYGGCHSSREHSQAPSQRSFVSHLHRGQALAQLSKEHFLTQGPQRSLKRFLADLWGKDFTAGSMDGTFQQNSTFLHRAVGQDPEGDKGRAHKQGDIGHKWQGEKHHTTLEVGNLLQLVFTTSCQGKPILEHGRSCSEACYAWSSP